MPPLSPRFRLRLPRPARDNPLPEFGINEEIEGIYAPYEVPPVLLAMSASAAIASFLPYAVTAGRATCHARLIMRFARALTI